jgi:hypothetical protein
VSVGPDGKLQSQHTGNKPLAAGQYIFVVTKDGRMIADVPKKHEIHHSSLAAGQPVRMAGEFSVDSKGDIQYISNTSGHFRPDANTFVQFAATLRKQGLDLSKQGQVMPVGFQSGGSSFDAVPDKNFDIRQLDKVAPSGILKDMKAPAPTARETPGAAHLETPTPPTTLLSPAWRRTGKQRVIEGLPEPLLKMAA